ncbi:MAG TPA: endonuclease domain-containing protein [Terriglobia bacterium]|nr:endonuclease domain-containing protein [Terriglobia bacterium]
MNYGNKPDNSPLPLGEGGRRPGEGKFVIAREAKALRRTQTQAERTAWHLLRDRRLAGLKFRRQYPIGKYTVDFYCFQLRLVIELEGSVHSQPGQMRKDAAREKYLRQLGIKVVYVPNGMVLQDPETFIRTMQDAIPSPDALRHPLPKGEG